MSFFVRTRTLLTRLRQAQEDVVTVNRATLHRLHTAQNDDQFQAAWRAIRDNFDVLYDDPRNVAELRQTILDLAVRGKLVPQDSNDEPAEELLKRIETEKNEVGAGKRKIGKVEDRCRSIKQSGKGTFRIAGRMVLVTIWAMLLWKSQTDLSEATLQ